MTKDDAHSTALKTSLVVLEEAKNDVLAAETQLEKVLADIRVAARAEKTAVSSAIEIALDRLRTARTKVAEAERTIAKEALVTQ